MQTHSKSTWCPCILTPFSTPSPWKPFICASVEYFCLSKNVIKRVTFWDLLLPPNLSTSRLSSLVFSYGFFLYFCSSVVISFLSFLVLFIQVLFSSWGASPEVCQFCLSFQKKQKKPTQLMAVFSVVLFRLCFIYFLFHLCYFLPSVEFRFCLFFF